MNSKHALQRGFSMISAVFLIVVLAAIGAGMASLSAIQHGSIALDVQGARAYQAARAGIEWGLYQTLIGASTDGCATAPTSFIPAAPTLQSFTVTVTCIDTPIGGANTTPSIVRQLTVVACNQPNGGNCPGTNTSGEYVERQLQATVQR